MHEREQGTGLDFPLTAPGLGRDPQVQRQHARPPEDARAPVVVRAGAVPSGSSGAAVRRPRRSDAGQRGAGLTGQEGANRGMTRCSWHMRCTLRYISGYRSSTASTSPPDTLTARQSSEATASILPDLVEATISRLESGQGAVNQAP